MKKTKIGLVCLTRKTFDYETAFAIYKKKVEEIPLLYDVNHTVDWVSYPCQVIEESDAEQAADFFAANQIDGLVIVSGTFHLGQLALILNKRIQKPILLWGLNELPYTGGKIRLNSVCGVNLDASNLYKGGTDNYCVHIGDDFCFDWVTAVRMKTSLEQAKVGLVGYRAQGFYNVEVDELKLYKELGVLLEHFELSDIFNQPASKAETDREYDYVRHTFDCSRLTEEQVTLVARLIVSAEKFVKKNGLDAVAIRCWPEFAKTYGISPCAMMSVLQARGIILACEGDVEAALSMIAVRAAGEETPYMADLSQVNYPDNYALLWHDGVAPCNLWDGKCVRSLETYFAGGKGVTADFVLKSGAMSIFRIDTARGETRLFYEEGNAVPMDKLLSGTYAKVVFKRHIKEIVDIVVYSGIAHHVIMGYVQYKNAVKMLSRIMGWKLICG